MNENTNAVRRIAVLDIETVSETGDPKGALDPKHGRIACIGLLFDDGQTLTPDPIADLDERKLLERFWTTIREDDLIVGHNILEFDLMFIRRRCWMLQVKPPFDFDLKKYYTKEVLDLMALWTNWSNRITGAGLDDIAQALGVGEKTGHGSDVAALWAGREYVKLMDYCMSDVWLTYQVYCRMHYRKPLGVPLPSSLTGRAPLSEASAPVAPTSLAPRHMPASQSQERELVPVLAASSSRVRAREQKGPEAAQTAQAPLLTTAETILTGRPPDYHAPALGAATSPAPREMPAAQSRTSSRRNGKKTPRITFVEMGGALVLGGGTFELKDALAAIGGQRTWQKDDAGGKDKCVWQLPSTKFDALAGICARHGYRLVDAGRNEAA